MRTKLSVGNPLPDALAHYVRETVETLARVNTDAELSRDDPRAERVGALEKLLYVPRTLNIQNARARRKQAHLQVWPSYGLLETQFQGRNAGRTAIIYHDPVPLQRQVGFDRLSRTIARRSTPRGAARIVSHTADATRELRALFPKHQIIEMMHPILTRQSPTEKSAGTVLIAGQFKPARDLALIEKLGIALKREGYRPRIVGRGWPENLVGWEVRSEFLPEAELIRELAEADLICLPYKHYFQSGIMLRALELGTLTVSPDTSFARDVLGEGSSSIVPRPSSAESWLETIKATTAREVDLADVYSRYQAACDESWARGLDLLTTH